MGREGRECVKITYAQKPKKIILGHGSGHGPGVLARSALHKHYYAEVHLMLAGSVVLTVENAVYRIEQGDMLIIPQGAYHTREPQGTDVRTIAFQIDLPECREVARGTLPLALMEDFFGELSTVTEKTDHTRLLAYISLAVSTLTGAFYEETAEKTDDSLLIEEFFFRRYDRDVTVKELAEVLHLSEKQTRLTVKKHTGRTFREELIHTRMKVAHDLAEHTGLPLADIAEKVGYQTYSGFWKRYKTYREHPGEDNET